MMCLEVVFKGKEKREALFELSNLGYYWKVCNLEDGIYKAEFRHANDHEDFYSFSIGWNETKLLPKCNGYEIGYHAFHSKKDAKYWKGNYSGWLRLVKCRIEKKDIVAIGLQTYGAINMLTVVTKRIWIPKPKQIKTLSSRS